MIDGDALEAEGVAPSIERRIYQAVNFAPRPRPKSKEIVEAINFVKRLRSEASDVSGHAFVDVAGGHGLIGMALLAFGVASQVTIIDPFRPGSFDTIVEAFEGAGLLPMGRGAVTYDERPLTAALPQLLDVEPGDVACVVACHACAHLSLQIVEIATKAHSPFIAVMPCCHSAKVLGPKVKAASDTLGLPLGVFADVALFGALGARGYTPQLRVVSGCADSSNRLILGSLRASNSDGIPPLWPGLLADDPGSAVENGEQKLKLAYTRVHNTRPAGTGRKARKKERRRQQVVERIEADPAHQPS